MEAHDFQRALLELGSHLFSRGIQTADIQRIYANPQAIEQLTQWIIAIRQGAFSIEEKFQQAQIVIEEDTIAPEIYGRLRLYDVLTLGFLQVLSEEDLLKIRSFGPKKLDGVTDYLYGYGLRLRYPNEPRPERVFKVLGGARSLPVSYLYFSLFMDFDKKRSALRQWGIYYLEDFSRFTIRDLQGMSHAYNRPVFRPNEIEALVNELYSYQLYLAG